MSTYSLPPIQSNYSSAFPHPNQPAFLPQSLADQSLDPNSPDVFKQNIQLVQQHVARVNSLARNALNGMLVIIESSRRGDHLEFVYRECAYHVGTSSSQTEGMSPEFAVDADLSCLHRSNSGYRIAEAEPPNAVRLDASNRCRRSSTPPYAFRGTFVSASTSVADRRNDAYGYITIRPGALR